jgi:hypothetical protein
MIKKSLLITVAVILCSQTSQAQFGQGQGQGYNRLIDLAGRLSREASDFSAASYRNYSTSFRSQRADVEAIMLAEQFSGATQVFYKMVNDRRRGQDLRDAYSFVQDLARLIDRTNLPKNSWYNVQRVMSDLQREVESGGGSDGGGGYPEQGRGGRMTWKGRVDDDIRITIRGGQADVETIGGTPYYDAQPNFSASLPTRRVNVTLNVKKSRGTVFIEQQPSRDNNFSVVVRIKDPRGGASEYEFELVW